MPLLPPQMEALALLILRFIGKVILFGLCFVFFTNVTKVLDDAPAVGVSIISGLLLMIWIHGSAFSALNKRLEAEKKRDVATMWRFSDKQQNPLEPYRPDGDL